MKYLFLLLLCFLATSAYNNAFGVNPESTLLFSISKNKIVRVGAINNTDKSMRLLIADSKGVLLFERSIKSGESYFQFHDLSTLPEGSYYVELSRGKQSTRKMFVIVNSNIKIISQWKNRLLKYFPRIEYDNIYVFYT